MGVVLIGIWWDEGVGELKKLKKLRGADEVRIRCELDLV